jgi:hypothetical protein
MAVYWRLKELLEAQGIHGAAGLHRALVEDLGLKISPQAFAKMLRKPPEALRITTAQAICTLFHVPLQDFLVITPDPIIKSASIIQPYRANPQETETLFIDPAGFL